MRRVPLSYITPEMCLAKSIYHCNKLLLSEGTSDLGRFITSLENLGIASIYVNDGISDDIDIPDVVSDELRLKCKTTLQKTIERLHSEGSFNTEALSNVARELIDEILQRPDVLLSLHDLSTTDDSTLVHSVNTTILALLIGQEANLSITELKILAEGCLLHDIGKTVIDPQILYKSGTLTTEEFDIVKQHTTIGYELLKKNPLMTELSRIIALSHHERLDGSGYPNGLSGDQIHIMPRIVAIADMYDALTSVRCYRRSMSNHRAYEIMSKDAGTKLDANLLALFFKNVAIYPNGSIVNLSNGLKGIVKAQNANAPFRPIVRLINDKNKEAIKLYDINLLQSLNVTILD